MLPTSHNDNSQANIQNPESFNIGHAAQVQELHAQLTAELFYLSMTNPEAYLIALSNILSIPGVLERYLEIMLLPVESQEIPTPSTHCSSATKDPFSSPIGENSPSQFFNIEHN